MIRAIFILFGCILLVSFCVSPAEADFEAGVIAYKQGDFHKAFIEFMHAAKQGHTAAQYKLGDLYYFGKGVDQNYQKAFKWYRMAAEQGLSAAQNDLSKGLKWIRKVAERGEPAAQFVIGRMYLDGEGVGRDYAVALGWIGKSARNGYPPAQYHLAMMTKNGQGTEIDNNEALKWLTRAADNGFATAQYELAAWYYNGQAWNYSGQVDKADMVKGREYMLKAAQGGDLKAQEAMFRINQTGSGGEINTVRAYMWLEIAMKQAGRQKKRELQYYQFLISEKMSSDQIAEAKRLAAQWKPKKQ